VTFVRMFYHRPLEVMPRNGTVPPIIGLGIDASDLAGSPPRSGGSDDRYTLRSPDEEIAYCTRHRIPAMNLAPRFAAKEAGVEALASVALRTWCGVVSKWCTAVRRR